MTAIKNIPKSKNILLCMRTGSGKKPNGIDNESIRTKLNECKHCTESSFYSLSKTLLLASKDYASLFLNCV